MTKPLGRRTLLRGAGGAALALPFLEAMLPARVSAQAAPKRFIAVYTPCGTIPEYFWPTGTEDNFTLPRILKPLEAHKDDLLILGGIDNLASKDPPGDAHQKGTGSALTGVALQAGEFIGMGGEIAGWAGGKSLDQEIASAIAGDTAKPSLEAGVGVVGFHVGSCLSYGGPGLPIPPESRPHALYARAFGDPAISKEDRENRKSRRGLVLDLVLDQATALRSKLGSGDREKLEAHLESIHAIETQLSKPEVTFGGECQPLDLGPKINPYDSRSYEAVGRLQMQIIARAMACDITRVATLMWTNSAARVVYNWVNTVDGTKPITIKDEHHTIAHKGNGETSYVAQNSAINRWHAEQLAFFISELKAIDEGAGTAFDSSAILWTNEQSTGNDHSRADMPYVIAGSAGGYFNTGRYVRFAPKIEDRKKNEAGEAHNRLLTSLAQAYGVETDAFGTAKYGTGALPGLKK
jgi:hypothetical protein